MRLLLYGAVSTLLTGAVLYSTFLTPTHIHPPFRRNSFYTSAISLSNSSASLLVLLNFGIFGTLLWGKALQAVFFGSLRAIEVEHLYERSWFAVTETCLAMTIFRDEFDAPFVTLFVALLFTKIFHWLCQDRVDFMEQSLQVPVVFHIRMITLMTSLLVVDSIFVAYSVKYTLAKGANMLIVFGFEYAILVATLLATFSKYIVHVLDSRTEEAWENKSMYIFYLELVTDFMKLIIYLIFFVIVLTYYGVPLHIIRDIYVTLRSFLQKCRDLVRYRQATRNMNERYPDATMEELARMTDPTCIICREDMIHRDDALARQRQQLQSPPPGPAAREGRNPMSADIPKKLPCGHVFHFSCLRSWLERQQSCPTCRSPVLNQDINTQPPARPQPPAQAPEPANQPPAATPLPQNPPPNSPANTPFQEAAGPQAGPQAGPSLSAPDQLPQQLAQNLSSIPPSRTIPGSAMPAIIPLGDIEAPSLSDGISRFRLSLLPPLSEEELQQLGSGTREAMLQRLDLIQRSQAHLVAVATVLSQALSVNNSSTDPAASSSSATVPDQVSNQSASTPDTLSNANPDRLISVSDTGLQPGTVHSLSHDQTSEPSASTASSDDSEFIQDTQIENSNNYELIPDSNNLTTLSHHEDMVHVDDVSIVSDEDNESTPLTRAI